MKRLSFAMRLAGVALLASGAALSHVSPAQAHPIYKRAFGNVSANQCLWAPGNRQVEVYLNPCGLSPNTGAKWKLHVVYPSYGPGGNQVWVLESATSPGSCVWVDSPGSGKPLLNHCRYNEAGKAPQFEAFHLGGYRFKLKSIGDWEYHGGSKDGCLASGNSVNAVLRPCWDSSTEWNVTATNW